MSLKQVYNIVESIAATPSLNEKEKIIRDSLDIPYFRKVAYYALNTLMKYKITEVKYAGSMIAEDEDKATNNIFEFLYFLSNKSGATDEDRQKLSFMSSLDQPTNVIVNRILKGDLRCGASIKLFRKYIPEIPIHEPMLCGKDFNKFMKLAGSFDNVVTSIKLDGVRVWCIVTESNVKYLSRNGKEYSNFNIFNEDLIEICKEMDLPYPIILDGEITTKDKKFQKLLTQFRRITEVDEDSFELTLFDIVLNKPFYERYEKLKEHFTLDYEKINRISLLYHSTNFNTEQKIFDFLNQVAKEGKEGLVLKTLNGPYEFKRSNHWVKLKKFYEEDLPVIGFEMGTGKYSDMLGALICDYNGVEVKVGSGFTDEERIEFLENIPELIEVKFQSLTEDKSLRFPIFLRIREDK